MSPGMVLIMDNATIHHSLSDVLHEDLERQEVIIEYLPPYSPDFNPIENTFGVLKQYIRAHWGEQDEDGGFETFLHRAVESAIGTDCVGFFRYCGYSN